MAEKLRELYVEVGFQDDGAVRGLKQVDEKADDATDTTMGLQDALVALGGAAVLAAFKSLASESFAAYQELEKQQVLLRN